MEKVCSGFGHRTVFGNIELAVQACVIQAIEMGCTVFYTGAMGEFDRVFISAVRAAKRRYPALGLRLICVKPYLTNEMNTHKAQYDALYDDVLVPEELMGLHYKRAIPARNRWMVDRSDMVIGYVIPVVRMRQFNTPGHRGKWYALLLPAINESGLMPVSSPTQNLCRVRCPHRTAEVTLCKGTGDFETDLPPL